MILNILILCFILIAIVCIDGNNDFRLLENSIKELESYLSRIGKGDGSEESGYLRVSRSVSKAWAQLGGLYLLRSKPLSYETKANALNCYSQAITIISDEDNAQLLDENDGDEYDENDGDEYDEDDAIQIRYEYTLSWSLQKGILLSLLGRGEEAVSIYDEMLLYIQIVDKKRFKARYHNSYSHYKCLLLSL